MMIELEFWMGADRVVCHSVRQEDIDACYALPKSTDRFAYWRKITGDDRIQGPILVWSPKEKKVTHG